MCRHSTRYKRLPTLFDLTENCQKLPLKSNIKISFFNQIKMPLTGGRRLEVSFGDRNQIAQTRPVRGIKMNIFLMIPYTGFHPGGCFQRFKVTSVFDFPRKFLRIYLPCSSKSLTKDCQKSNSESGHTKPPFKASESENA